jgi:hypothetical protein
MEMVPAYIDEVLNGQGAEIARAYGQFAEGEMTVAYMGEAGIALNDGLDPKVTFDTIHAEATAPWQ